MGDAVAALKALSLETKALIIVSEFEARRMPMFQMRAVLAAIVRDDEERKNVIDMIEKDLRATGYPEQQLATFLSELIITSPTPPTVIDASIQNTRRLRSPFALGFESTAAEPAASLPPPDTGTFITRAAGAQKPAGPVGPAPIPAPAIPRGSGGTAANLRPMAGPIQPPAVPPAPGSAPTPPQRRPTSSVNLPRAGGSGGVPAVEPLQPVGTKSLLKHELGFGKTVPSMMPVGTPSAPATRPIILVADDDKRIRMVFKLRLEDSGFAVVEAADGLEAWARVQEGDLALVVLDMKMPGLHGLEVLSRMIDKQIGTPVIVCSAYDQLENEFVVQTHPKLKYLTKPVAPDALVATARELIARK